MFVKILIVSGMNKRTGTDIDARNLKNIFKKLGFNVLLKKDATCHQLCQVLLIL